MNLPISERFNSLRASNKEIRYLFFSSINQIIERLIMLPVIWDVMTLMSLHYNGHSYFTAQSEILHKIEIKFN